MSDDIKGMDSNSDKEVWVCFHCGERFKTASSALWHLGKSPSAKTGCPIKTEATVAGRYAGESLSMGLSSIQLPNLLYHF